MVEEGGVHTERITTVQAAWKIHQIHQARKIRKIHPAAVLVQKGKRLHRKQHQKVHQKWYQRVHQKVHRRVHREGTLKKDKVS